MSVHVIDMKTFSDAEDILNTCKGKHLASMTLHA